MKYVYILIAGMMFFGCSTTQPPVTEFRIKTQIQDGSFKSKGCIDKSLKVAQAFSSNSLMTLNMNYAQGEHKQFVYTQSQWAESPNLAITAEILKLLRETKLFKTVQISKSRTKNDLILEINIEDFMQYFSDDHTSSYANVVVNLTIVDATSSGVIGSKTFLSRVDAKTLDAVGGVEALNAALLDVLSQSSLWLNKVCR